MTFNFTNKYVKLIIDDINNDKIQTTGTRIEGVNGRWRKKDVKPKLNS